MSKLTHRPLAGDSRHLASWWLLPSQDSALMETAQELPSQKKPRSSCGPSTVHSSLYLLLEHQRLYLYPHWVRARPRATPPGPDWPSVDHTSVS